MDQDEVVSTTEVVNYVQHYWRTVIIATALTDTNGVTRRILIPAYVSYTFCYMVLY